MYALEAYTGIRRATKDLDLFILRDDWPRVVAALAAEDVSTALTFPHWLGKARQERHYVDLLFSSGNGVCPVDREWFAHARDMRVWRVPARLCPPEEMIWTKSFVQERERFDGGDVLHLIRAQAGSSTGLASSRASGPRLGGAAQPPRVVRVRVSGRPSSCAGRRHRTTARPMPGSTSDGSGKSLSRHAAVARAGPDRRRGRRAGSTRGLLPLARCRRMNCCRGRLKSPRHGARRSPWGGTRPHSPGATRRKMRSSDQTVD